MKTHLNLATRDLEASMAFYRTLLNSQPAKQYEDYALFLTEDPGLELALSFDPRAKSSEDVHYGIAVETPDLVGDAIERLKGAGLPMDIETEQICCYANQNKVWATDPDGRRWETYYVISETETRNDENMTCCQTSQGDIASCC